MTQTNPAPKPTLLENLGLHRPELRAWAMYDWASTVFFTIIITTTFAPYFEKVAGSTLREGQAASMYPLITTIAIGLSAIFSLLVGAVADALGAQKRILMLFTIIGALATASMWFVREGDWQLGAVLFIVANVSIMSAFVCYNALLPHIARPDEVDRVSAGGFAMGYIGSSIALTFMVLMYGWFPEQANRVTRIGFVFTGAWWLAFALPVFLRVKEPLAKKRMSPVEAIGGMFGMLAHTLRDVLRQRNLVLFLAAFLLYSDGINTIIRMAARFGSEVGIAQGTMVMAILLTQIVGVPFAFLFGYLTRFFAPKHLVIAGICIYTVISLVGYQMSTAAHFITLAILVGTVQGGTQALSRSIFARMIPADRSGEYFSVYGIMDRFSGAIGSGLLFVFALMTGSSRLGVLGVALMFILGGLLLWRVKTPVADGAGNEART